MTPQRKAYMARCSEKELVIRKNIKEYKAEIKWFKEVLTNGYDFEFDLGLLRWRKFHLMLFKHELARLKGMDRVVRVKKMSWLEGVNCLISVCKCGEDVFSAMKYCSNCGRRILWEKVKHNA